MGHADAGAGQHGDGQLGDHRHVHRDAVAGAQTQAQQHVGEALHIVEQLRVGDSAGVAGLALPVEGHLVAGARGDVAVEAVVGHVERAAHEPLSERQIPGEGGVEVVMPGEQVAGLACPEGLEVGGGLVVEGAVGYQRRGRETRRRRERATLALVDLYRARCHGQPSLMCACSTADSSVDPPRSRTTRAAGWRASLPSGLGRPAV